jgi:hypothetical protein
VALEHGRTDSDRVDHDRTDAAREAPEQARVAHGWA